MLQAYYSWIKDQIITDVQLAALDVKAEWYLRQYYAGRGSQDGGLVIETPICYVEIMPIVWRTLPMSIQRAVMTFRVHTLTDTVHADDRSFVLPSPTQDVNSQHMAIRERVYTLLMNKRVHLNDLAVHLGGPYKIDGQDAVAMESIVRISSPVTSEQLDDMILSIEEFQCVVTDYTASPLYQKVEDVQLEVNCETIVQP